MGGETVVIEQRRPREPRGPLSDRWLWAGVIAAVVLGITLVSVILLTARTGTLPIVGAIAGQGASGADPASATLAQTIEQGTALAASTTANQLADPTAYSQLMGALTLAQPALDGTPQEIEMARRNIVAAMDRVSRSQSAKVLADAQTELSSVIGTAVQVNAGAAGRVADDAVRDELQARIDAGWALLSTNAAVEAVAQQAQTITDQTAMVLAARFMGFREADGRWCATNGKSCVSLAWPVATLSGDDSVRLTGGENALDGSGCYATDEFAVGRGKAALLFCPAGESIPEGRRASGGNEGDVDRDRLWTVDGSRLTDLRYRA